MTQDDRQTKKGTDLRLVELTEMRGREKLAPKFLARLRQHLHWRRILGVLLYPVRAIRNNLADLARVRYFILLTAAAFIAAAGLAVSGLTSLALMPALLGFGLSMAALVYGAFPQLSSRLDKFPWHVSLATWALGTAICTFVGFSSTLVVFLVLFIGGFTVANVVWSLLPKIIEFFNPLPRDKTRGVMEATASPLPLLLVFGVIASWSLVASLIMARTGIHEHRPWGTAFLAAHMGLLLGLAPMEFQMLKEWRRPTRARWNLFKPTKLLSHVIFAMIVSALVGYEVTLASDGSALAGIPTFALALVLVSYLGVIVRQPFSLGTRLKPYHPLVLPAFGTLLLFAPTVVLLSSPPVEVTKLYGAAQAAGLILGALLIVVTALWRERAHRIRVRLQEAMKERVPITPSKPEESRPYTRIGVKGDAPRGSDIHVREVNLHRDEGDE